MIEASIACNSEVPCASCYRPYRRNVLSNVPMLAILVQLGVNSSFGISWGYYPWRRCYVHPPNCSSTCLSTCLLVGFFRFVPLLSRPAGIAWWGGDYLAVFRVTVSDMLDWPQFRLGRYRWKEMETDRGWQST